MNKPPEQATVVAEDVKGWWGPKHCTFLKITTFQQQYPEVDFRIVLRRGLS